MRLNVPSDLEKSIINIGLIVSACFLISIGISRIAYPFDYGGYEAGIWAPADLSIHGINPYKTSLTLTPPYIMSPYGIVYYLTVGLGLNCFGLQFWFARIISVICAAICALCLRRLTYKFTGNQLMGMLSPLLFLSQFPLQSFIGVQRPDLLALALSLSGITIALTTNPVEKKLKTALLLIAQALILLGAVFTRQTSFLPIGVVSLWYLFNKLYSRLFIFLLTIVSFLIILLLWLNYTPSNGYLWQQWLLASSVEQTFKIGVTHFIGFITSLVTIGILFLGILIWRSPKSQASGNIIYSRVLFIYFIFSLLLSVVTASRMGSNINYYLELTAVIAMIVPLYIDRMKGYLIEKRKYYLLILIFIVLSTSFTGLRICRGEYYRW